MSGARRTGALLVILATLVASRAMADTRLAVIANPATAAPYDRQQLADIFLGNLRIDDQGRRIVAVNLPSADPLRGAFSQAVLNNSPDDLEAYWNERYFHGISPPYVVASVEAMLRFIAATPGAIGYVPGCAVDARVAVITAIDVPDLPHSPCKATPPHSRP